MSVTPVKLWRKVFWLSYLLLLLLCLRRWKWRTSSAPPPRPIISLCCVKMIINGGVLFFRLRISIHFGIFAVDGQVLMLSVIIKQGLEHVPSQCPLRYSVGNVIYLTVSRRRIICYIALRSTSDIRGSWVLGLDHFNFVYLCRLP